MINSDLKVIFEKFNVWLTLEIANICNLRCTMCNVREVDPLVPGLMDFDVFRKIMDEIVEEDLRIFGLKLFWLGEPLLHPQFSQILDYIPVEQVNRTVAFDTNCQLLDEENAEAIIRRCRDCKLYIFLSLDGLDDDVYSSMRTNGSRETAYRNVHRLLDLRKKAGLTFPKVRIQFIVHENNFHDLKPFINYWRSKDYWDELPVMDDIQDDRDFIHVRKWITGERQDVADKLYDQALTELGIRKQDMPANIDGRNCHTCDFPCENLFAMPMIRSNGDVTVCNNDVELALKVGNISKESFLEVWCGEAVNRLRRQHLSGWRGKIEKCQDCISAQRTYFPDAMEEMKVFLCNE